MTLTKDGSPAGSTGLRGRSTMSARLSVFAVRTRSFKVATPHSIRRRCVCSLFESAASPRSPISDSWSHSIEMRDHWNCRFSRY